MLALSLFNPLLIHYQLRLIQSTTASFCPYCQVWAFLARRTPGLNRTSQGARSMCHGKVSCLYLTTLPQGCPKCKVCVLSVSNFCVCLPCVVACLFPCLVLVLPCSRHVLSLCLFVCAMYLGLPFCVPNPASKRL